MAEGQTALDRERYHSYMEAELEDAAMYRALAGLDKDAGRIEVFRELQGVDMRHARVWAEKLGAPPPTPDDARLDLKGRLIIWTARAFGVSRVMPLLLREEATHIRAYGLDPAAREIAREERHHSRLLRGIADDSAAPGLHVSEWRHMLGTGGGLRAAVLGINDGLVSNLSLVTGVAGGTGDSEIVLLAGVAGLLAGAFSMAAGEYVSVRSQREIYEYHIRVQREEIRSWPEEEEKDLVQIYRKKGLSELEAERVAKRVMTDPEVALDTLSREELGLTPSQLGSPWWAGVSSFAAFVAGAIVPILPYVFGAEALALTLSATLSGLALLAAGAVIAWMASRSVAWGAMRMLLVGAAAASATYGIGRLIGVSVLG